MADSSTQLASVVSALLAAAATALSLAACGSSSDGNLFSHQEVQRAPTAGASGNDSGSGGSRDVTGSAGVGGTSSGGSTGGNEGGGMANGQSGDASTNGGGSSAGSNSPPLACIAYGAGATYFSESQHCYLVVPELSTFADARAHCAALGAHLLTIASEAENTFAWNLSPAEHWIGATDGKDAREAQPGTYAWITGEPFGFQKWSGGQPNASQIDCAGHSGGGGCFEHCAFQWAGGTWNDRSCDQTTQSICEWDGVTAAR